VADEHTYRTPCEMCGGAREEAFTTTDRNRAVTRRTFTYVRCTACGTYALRGVPDDLGEYYPGDYYAFPTAADLARAAGAPSEQAKLAMIAQRVSAGRLIEIGPGGGEFCLAAQRAGFDVTAIEMDSRVCTHLERTVGVAAIRSAEPERVLETLPPSDVVAMWHVLEHLRRPGLALERIAANLRPGGVVALAVPNPQSLQFRLLRGRWAHVDAPRHLFLLPLSAVAARGARHGLRLLDATSSDPAGRHWNEFGWEYALRRFPARRPSTPSTRLLARAITTALSPLERRDLQGCAYTAILVKDGG